MGNAMPLPNELHMPSLAHLDRNFGTIMLNVALARGGPRDDLLRRHFLNVVRLVDLCVSEYEIARGFFEASLPGGEERLGAILTGVDHLELCIITVRRAFNALEAIIHHQDAPNIPKFARRALKAIEGPLIKTRGAVVHIEEEILRGDIEPGQSHALLPSEDGRTASIGRYEISFKDLARAIQLLHEQTATLAKYREELPE